MFLIAISFLMLVADICELNEATISVPLRNKNTNSDISLMTTIDESGNYGIQGALKWNRSVILSKRISYFDITTPCYRIKRHQIINNGLVYVISNGIFKGLLDILRFWDIKQKRIIIIEAKLGYNENAVISYFQENNFLVDILTIKTPSEEWFDLLVEYRYIVLLTSESLAHNLLIKINRSQMFLTFRNWMIVSPNIPQIFSDIKLRRFSNPLESQVTFLKTNHDLQISFKYDYRCTGASQLGQLLLQTEEINLYDAFYNAELSKLQYENFATWKYFKGFVYTNELSNKVLPLLGRPIRLITTDLVPYVIYDKNESKPVGGSTFAYFTSVGEHLGANHVIIVENDRNLGSEVNGSFNGIMGFIQRGEADVALATFAVSASRKVISCFLGITGKGNLQMVIPKPDYQIPPTIYVLPFQLNVWMIVIATTIVLSAAVVVVFMTNPTNMPFKDEITSNKKFLIWLISGKFLDSVFDSPPGLSAKVISCTLLATVMILFFYYSSVFTSFLAYKEIKLPFRNLEELVQNKDYNIVLIKWGKHQELFAKAPNGTFKQVWDKVVRQKTNLRPSYQEAFEYMLTGKNVFLTIGSITGYFAKGSCKTTFIPALYMKEYFHTLGRKDFPYLKLYSRSLLKIWEGGIADRWEKNLMKYDDSACEERNKLDRLGLQQVFTLFVILTSGYLLSLLVLIGEITYYRMHRHL